jgi:hypothetical protein
MPESETDEHIEVAPVEARQGFLDRPILAIALVSTALAALVLAAFVVGSVTAS